MKTLINAEEPNELWYTRLRTMPLDDLLFLQDIVDQAADRYQIRPPEADPLHSIRQDLAMVLDLAKYRA